MAAPYPVGPTSMPPLPPGGAGPGGAAPTSRVELRISCANLQDKDVFSKSDPIVAVYQMEKGSQRWIEVSYYMYYCSLGIDLRLHKLMIVVGTEFAQLLSSPGV